jgi:hypothetical protein
MLKASRKRAESGEDRVKSEHKENEGKQKAESEYKAGRREKKMVRVERRADRRADRSR